MYDFEVLRPATVAEAVTALAEEDAQALAGGQTLIPALKARLAMPSRLVSLSRVAELQGVRRDGDGPLCIGAGATHADILSEAAPHYPALASLAARVGDPAVRNRGTIGGSLANNDPAACYPAAALASGATIVTNTREIAADDFFLGMFTTALDEGEIVTEIRFPVPLTASYQKFAQPASHFALVGVFLARFPDGVRVAVTGASEDGVFRWEDAERALSAAFDAAALEAVTLSPESLMDDLHGTPEYRAHLAGVLLRRAMVETA